MIGGSGTSRTVTTVSGTINVPQRGSVTVAGSSTPKPVTTTSGTAHSSGIDMRSVAGAAAGLLDLAATLAIPRIQQWIAESRKAEWDEEARTQVREAIDRNMYLFQIEIARHQSDIQRARADGRSVKLRIDVDTDWIASEYGPGLEKATVSYYRLLFEGDTELE